MLTRLCIICCQNESTTRLALEDSDIYVCSGPNKLELPAKSRQTLQAASIFYKTVPACDRMPVIEAQNCADGLPLIRSLVPLESTYSFVCMFHLCVIWGNLQAVLWLHCWGRWKRWRGLGT